MIFVQLKLMPMEFSSGQEHMGSLGLSIVFAAVKVANGGYAIAGHTSSFGAGDVDVCLLRINDGGSMLWTKTYGRDDSDVPNFVSQAADGGFVITGYTQDAPAGNTNFFLVRTDSSGDMLWSKSYGGNNNDEAYSVMETADGGFMVNGFSYSFGTGSVDLYVVKTDSSGNSGCNQSIPATIQGTATFQMFSFPFNILAGAIVSSPAFTTAGGSTLTNPCIATGVEDVKNESQFYVYPNPAGNQFTIYPEYAGRFTIAEIEIYSALGEKVFEKNQTSDIGQLTISIANFLPGIYFVKIKGEQSQSVIKLVKE
jgi:hypothetical protein